MKIVGLCHTDIHMRDGEWRTSDYPLVLGHEGVAVVRRIGADVSTLAVGDRVAISWVRDSCGECDPCSKGRENICTEGFQGIYLGRNAGPWGKSPLKYNEHGGCFVKVQRIEERFAIKIPDGLPSEMACPLLCGGATVFEPIMDYAKPGARLGISSIGGLGTAAIKLGKLRNCHVVAISGSPDKREGALTVGADEFVNSKNPEEVKKIAGTLDIIIDTTPVNSNITPLMDMLRFNGVYVRVGIPAATDQLFSYEYLPLIFQQKKIAGSIVTGSKRMKEMLDLARQNLDFMKDADIWKTQHVPMDQINEAMDSLKNRTNKGYRLILEW